VLDADILRRCQDATEGLQRHRCGEMGHEVLDAYTEVKAVTTQLSALPKLGGMAKISTAGSPLRYCGVR